MAGNNLIHETSPYLLQHADNPVDWYGWNDEALKKAKDENKPIFLSIGYSACHWCHVMAHESFENNDVAEFMNEHFVNIKVDREERPDIDDIYQKVCQIATGQGGWPLSIFLTPDQKPFYAGTYFPVLDSYGRPGFGSICRQLAQAWKEKPKDVEKSAESFLYALQKTEKITTPSKLERTLLDEAAMNLFQLGDPTYGGFGSAPKFPNAANISFLFRYAKMANLSKFNEFALKTLKKMAKGGIFDQIGGGFHRYSTDTKWLVPHFEKMLYDNAQLLSVYSNGYKLFKEDRFLKELHNIYNFLDSKMTGDNGLIFSSISADTNYSNGTKSEGDFYVWKADELKNILKKDFDWVSEYYNINQKGYWEKDNYVFYQTISDTEFASKLGISLTEFEKKLSKVNLSIRKEREKRVHPIIDNKIIFSWNALTIRGLVDSYKITKDQKFLTKALVINNSLVKHMINKNIIQHTNSNFSSVLFLEDYSYYIDALIGLYEVTFDQKFLNFDY